MRYQLEDSEDVMKALDYVFIQLIDSPSHLSKNCTVKFEAALNSHELSRVNLSPGEIQPCHNSKNTINIIQPIARMSLISVLISLNLYQWYMTD